MAVESRIKDLIETLEDGRKGFEEAANRLAEDGHGSIAERMRTLSNQRGTFSAELRDIAASDGVQIQEEGSIGGALHRGWMSLKDALTGESAEAILDAVKTGESHAVDEYDDALEDGDVVGTLRDVIARQGEAVRSARDEVEQMSIS